MTTKRKKVTRKRKVGFLAHSNAFSETGAQRQMKMLNKKYGYEQVTAPKLDKKSGMWCFSYRER